MSDMLTTIFAFAVACALFWIVKVMIETRQAEQELQEQRRALELDKMIAMQVRMAERMAKPKRTEPERVVIGIGDDGELVFADEKEKHGTNTDSH